jgi:hypothetical protein
MNKLINNMINGNLTDAKKQAKRFNVKDIRETLLERGYTFKKATLTAEWLKGNGDWQSALMQNDHEN